MGRKIKGPREFYVYIYHDPRVGKKNVPIYVGKGNRKKGSKKSERAWSHWNQKAGNVPFQGVLNKIRRTRLIPIVAIIEVGEQEEDAFAFERVLIAKYGRRDLGLGTLLNLTDGGDGVAGRVFTDAFIRRLTKSIRRFWKNNLEARAAASERFKLYWQQHPEAKLTQADRMRKRSVEYWQQEGIKEAFAALSSERWANPDYSLYVGARVANGLRDFWSDPRSDELRKRLSERWHQQSESLLASIRTPEARAKKAEFGRKVGYRYIVAYSQSERGRKEIGINSKARWDDPEWKAKTLAARVPAKHTVEFKEAQRIRMKAYNESRTPEERKDQARKAGLANSAKNGKTGIVATRIMNKQKKAA